MKPTQEEAALAWTPTEHLQGAESHTIHPASQGEALFLESLFAFTRSAQAHPDRSYALAARRWERSLRFKLAVNQQRRCRTVTTATPTTPRNSSVNSSDTALTRDRR